MHLQLGGLSPGRDGLARASEAEAQPLRGTKSRLEDGNVVPRDHPPGSRRSEAYARRGRSGGKLGSGDGRGFFLGKARPSCPPGGEAPGRILSRRIDASSSLHHRIKRGRGHPTRIRILDYLAHNPVSSPDEMRRAGVGGGLSHIAYHTQVLAGLGLIEEVRNEPVRGATKHFYRRTEIADGPKS